MYGILLGFALMASAISTNKLILIHLPATFFVAIRMLTAGILLIGLGIMTSPRLRLNYLKLDAHKLLLISLLTTGIPSMLKAYALKNLFSAKAAFLGSLDPFITALYAYWLWNEKLTRNKIIGIFLGFVGTIILLASTSPLEKLTSSWWIFSLPELAALLAVAIQRYGWIQAGELLKSARYLPSELNGIIMLVGSIFSFITAYFFNEIAWDAIPMTPHFWSLFAYTVLVGNMVAYTIYAHYLKKYSPTFMSLVGLSIPLCVQLYAPILIGEPLSPTFFVALGITFVGLYAFYCDERKKL